jgi:hypothetical protein
MASPSLFALDDALPAAFEIAGLAALSRRKFGGVVGLAPAEAISVLESLIVSSGEGDGI